MMLIEVQSNKSKLLPAAIGYLVPITLPVTHIAVLYSLWSPFKYPVKRDECSCTCWDTIFKGSYESGIAGFKHVYVNATYNACMIWVLTVSTILVSYECTKKIVRLGVQGQLRFPMCILLLAATYPHYYTW